LVRLHGAKPSVPRINPRTFSEDFNNDGVLDLITINYTTLSFYKGLGGGKYAPAVNQSIQQTTSGGFGQVFG